MKFSSAFCILSGSSNFLFFYLSLPFLCFLFCSSLSYCRLSLQSYFQQLTHENEQTAKNKQTLKEIFQHVIVDSLARGIVVTDGELAFFLGNLQMLNEKVLFSAVPCPFKPQVFCGFQLFLVSFFFCSHFVVDSSSTCFYSDLLKYLFQVIVLYQLGICSAVS